MTVQKDLVKNIYVGNGSTTQFPITFDVNAEQPGYIHVYISNDDNSTTETENYTVDLISKIVTYPKSGEPLASGKKLVIMRELPLMQLMDLINQGDYYADDVEQAFDDLTMIAQQLSEKLARAMVFSVEVDTANFSNIIPLAPGMSFRINDEGTGLELTEDPAKVLPKAQNLLQQTTQQANIATEKSNAAAVSETNAAESESNAASSETNAAASEEMAQKWAESETSPDGEDDADSPTGDTMSSKEWALYAKQLAQQIGNPVVDVTESNGTVTIEKSDGTSSSFDIPQPIIATQEEAEAGTDNTKFMTPLRVAQAIDAQTQDLSQGLSNAEDKISELEDSFAIIYPNGGTEEIPANVTINNRYIEENPFPGYYVSCIVELLIEGEWAEPFMAYVATDNGGRGVTAGLVNDNIIVQTGKNYLKMAGCDSGSLSSNGISVKTAPCRVLVHKLGKIGE